MRKAILFPHWTEIFILLRLAGAIHGSWWWLAAFVICDAMTGCATPKQKESV